MILYNIILSRCRDVFVILEPIAKQSTYIEDFIPFAWGYKNYGMAVEFHPRETFFSLGSWQEEDIAMVWVL